MDTPSNMIETTVTTTQPYSGDDITNEINRRDNLSTAIRIIDDNYILQ